MSGADGWIRVPIGDDAARWATRGRTARVLLVVHNVTAATRLLDVLPLFHDDLRVQLLATCPGSSAFRAGTAELLADLGIPVLPWEQAVSVPVSLAVSASFGGRLRDVRGRLAVLSHGVGYSKTLAPPGAASGAPAPVFGMSPEWLLDAGGRPVADALVLSHPEQYERLRAVCPEAAPSAVVAGDPCWDRMLAARPYRDRYRRALGAGRDRRLIVLSSTWNPESLFGDGGDDVLPSLLPRLADEFPLDEYRFAAVLHPNVWHGHGPGQIRAWLDRARRSGLALIDPLTGWRQALIAADAVLGDHGSVTYYAAALGTPVLLGPAPSAGLAPDAPVRAFVREAPRLVPGRPLRPQVEALLDGFRPAPGPARFTSSVPGESAARLRRLFYGLAGLREPEAPARLEPLPLPPYEPGEPRVPLLVRTRLLGSGEMAVTRYAGTPPDTARNAAAGDAHLAVHEDTRETDRLDLADVVFRYGADDDPRLGAAERWTAEVLDRHPRCALAARVTAPGTCVVRPRGGEPLRLTAGPGADADPAAYASALHAWLAAGGTPRQLYGRGLTVRVGAGRHRVGVAAST
ncbi:hypothetical protein [Streptomyces daghestanicus]|uniref:Translation initiation factor IF-2 n=1 Tax=Streptomyces daghestanicus TaxID=66885 RepID=A0ABQ3Q6P6_9ACTN|nr:hypothetical protein [Streptomyces daghestanicus]GGU31182.1 hypothetical protein GCM10010259_22020 [Streptomyces daghestanicus]GHI32934.1 hypothetical protein Sdagh_46640 [Streptomyces daghestanicus]